VAIALLNFSSIDDDANVGLILSTSRFAFLAKLFAMLSNQFREIASPQLGELLLYKCSWSFFLKPAKDISDVKLN
jgi:hypothetical protein